MSMNYDPEDDLIDLIDMTSTENVATSTAASTTTSTASPETDDTDADLVINPIEGRIINLQSIDDIVSAVELVDAQLDELYAHKDLLRRAAARHCVDQKTKTRRIEGTYRRAKVEMPDTNWSQPMLKQLWASMHTRFPELTERFLRIERLGVVKTELKKLQKTSTDNDQLKLFKSVLEQAETESTALPRVVVEK